MQSGSLPGSAPWRLWAWHLLGVFQAACTFLSHVECCRNSEVCGPDFSVALVFGFHFLILNLHPSPPNCITEGGRPERSLLLRGPRLWVLEVVAG